MAESQSPPYRLLTYNIQVGLHTRDYGHMVSGAWRHLWPSKDQHSNLERIAEMLSGFDFVAIQEADAGSLRTRSRNQIEFLARAAGFDHCGFIVTRDLHPVARHCHGWMSRAAPIEQQAHSLPSRIPGRAAMRLRYGEELGGLTILAAHLSLGGEDRRKQLRYIAGMAGAGERVVMLGDQLQTDILGAADAGIDAVLLTTGLTAVDRVDWSRAPTVTAVLDGLATP